MSDNIYQVCKQDEKGNWKPYPQPTSYQMTVEQFAQTNLAGIECKLCGGTPSVNTVTTQKNANLLALEQAQQTLAQKYGCSLATPIEQNVGALVAFVQSKLSAGDALGAAAAEADIQLMEFQYQELVAMGSKFDLDENGNPVTQYTTENTTTVWTPIQ